MRFCSAARVSQGTPKGRRTPAGTGSSAARGTPSEAEKPRQGGPAKTQISMTNSAALKSSKKEKRGPI